MTSLILTKPKARRPAGTLQQLVNARERCSGRSGNFLSEKGSRRQPVVSRGRRGDGILIFKSRRRPLCDLCGALCLCGDVSSRKVNHRDTEDHRAFTERIGLGLVIVLSLISLTASCSHRPNGNVLQSRTREVTDEAGRRVRLPEKIDRIVSLAPNLTEIVYAVGAGDQLVGNTEYCDYPFQAKSVAKVGDTTNPSVERIIALKPQVVLVSTASQLEAFTKQLDQQNIAVYVTNPQKLDDVFSSIQTLGDLFGHHDWTVTLLDGLRRRATSVDVAIKETKPIRTFYQVSDSPLYTIGRDSYLTDLVRRAGGVSVTGDVPGAYPRFSDEAALASRPEAIILPTGGSMGTANSKVAAALKNSPAVLNSRVLKINEDHLQRPGPRLVDGLEEMARALHPEVASKFGRPAPE
jgi:iron complex transport system substrate-binding protein